MREDFEELTFNRSMKVVWMTVFILAAILGMLVAFTNEAPAQDLQGPWYLTITVYDAEDKVLERMGRNPPYPTIDECKAAGEGELKEEAAEYAKFLLQMIPGAANATLSCRVRGQST